MKSSNRYAKPFEAFRAGAKAKFNQRQMLKDLQSLSKRIESAQANLREEQKAGEWRVASQDALSLSVLYKRLHDLLVEVAQSSNMSRPGAKARFAWSISDAVEAKKMTDYFKERISRMDPGNGAFVRSVARTHLSSLMSSLDEAASGGTITRMESQEMKKSAIEAYRAKFSRPGAKSNGLTLAQRIAVAHDAKRMALR